MSVLFRREPCVDTARRMASPSACGGLALVLSALKSEKLKWTPARLHKAVAATAKDVSDPLHIGMLQVEKLHEHLLAHQDTPDQDAEWIVQVTPQGRGEAMRGVYLREFEETRKLQQIAVNVAPKYKEQETDRYADLDMDLVLTSTQSALPLPSTPISKGLTLNDSLDTPS